MRLKPTKPALIIAGAAAALALSAGGPALADSSEERLPRSEPAPEQSAPGGQEAKLPSAVEEAPNYTG